MMSQAQGDRHSRGRIRLVLVGWTRSRTVRMQCVPGMCVYMAHGAPGLGSHGSCAGVSQGAMTQALSPRWGGEGNEITTGL
jgi:hypothetical protein